MELNATNQLDQLLKLHCSASIRNIRRHFITTFSRSFAVIFLIAAITALIPTPSSAQKISTVDLFWDGPVDGPVKQPGKKIVFISQDFRNGGITSAYRGLYLAAIELGWELSLVDSKNDVAILRAEINAAIQSHQDAIVFGGMQITDELQDLVAIAKQAKIVLAGWHAAEKPGQTKDLLINIATQSAEVGKKAAEYVIQNSGAEVGAIIFNDSRFAIANAKNLAMVLSLMTCNRCKILSIEDIPIPNANKEVPVAVQRLDQLYGKKWTHTLAINDAYFDAMNVALNLINRKDIKNISAGDGSYIALSRIKSGSSQQVATVAEPFGIQGWQLADELNRAFAGRPLSGYQSKPILITAQLLQQLKGADIDSGIPYKEAYSLIWRGKTPSK